MSNVVRTVHSSGRWDRSAESLAANVKRTRKHGSIVTRTEVTRNAHHATIARPDDGWGVYHPRTADGDWTDCLVEWDQRIWEKVEAYLLPLSTIQIRNRNGFALPLSSMPVVVLRHRETHRHAVAGSFHLQLANTARRRAAWREETAAIRRFSANVTREHPGWVQILQGDVNRNQRVPLNRANLRRAAQEGTRLRNLWAAGLPEHGGTHGRSLLDVTLTTMRGRSWLLPDDASSDHRPYASEMSW